MPKTPELVELNIYTTPSTWTRDGALPTVAPYDRIVGTDTGNGLLACRDFDDVPRTEQSVVVTPALRERFHQFFQKVIIPHDPETPGSILNQSGDYNCHRFTFAMDGLDAGTTDRALPLAERLARRSNVADTPYPLGAAGVMWINDMQRGRIAVHSFIGLGKRVPVSLQVLATGGHVGLRRYDEMTASYDQLWHGAAQTGRPLSLLGKLGQFARDLAR
jgi:hypothetical protein